MVIVTINNIVTINIFTINVKLIDINIKLLDLISIVGTIIKLNKLFNNIFFNLILEVIKIVSTHTVFSLKSNLFIIHVESMHLTLNIKSVTRNEGIFSRRHTTFTIEIIVIKSDSILQ